MASTSLPPSALFAIPFFVEFVLISYRIKIWILFNVQQHDMLLDEADKRRFICVSREINWALFT